MEQVQTSELPPLRDPEQTRTIGELVMLDTLLGTTPTFGKALSEHADTRLGPVGGRQPEHLSQQENEVLFTAIERGAYAAYLLHEAEPGNTIQVKGIEYTQEEVQLIVEEGQRARTRFLDSNIRLIFWAINRYPARGKVADKLEAGYMAMDKALDTYDYRRTKWSTYAAGPLRWAMSTVGRRWYRSLKITPAQQAILHAVFERQKITEQTLGREVSVGAIAAALGYPADEVEALLHRYRNGLHDTLGVPIDTHGPDDNHTADPLTLADTRAAQDLEQVADRLYYGEKIPQVLQAIDALPEEQRTLVRYAAGLVDGKIQGYTTVAPLLGIDAYTARQHLRRGRAALRAQFPDLFEAA